MSVWLGIEVQAVPRPTDMKHPRAAEGCYLLAHNAGSARNEVSDNAQGGG